MTHLEGSGDYGQEAFVPTEQAVKPAPNLGFDQIVGEHLKEAVRDGMEVGCQMAIDALLAAQPHTDRENQTWDSAVAVLALVKSEYQKRRAKGEPR